MNLESKTRKAFNQAINGLRNGQGHPLSSEPGIESTDLYYGFRLGYQAKDNPSIRGLHCNIGYALGRLKRELELNNNKKKK